MPRSSASRVLRSTAVSENDAISAVTRAYAQLLSLAVHELRTPASVVGGYLRMLQRDPDHPLSERQKKMVDEAEKSCARLVALIAEMSDISKLDAGLAAAREEPFDAFTVAAEVAASVHEAEDREVRLQVRGEASGASMTGDLTRLRAAFSAFFRAVLREQAGACTVVVDRRLVKADGRASAVIVVAEEHGVQQAYETPPAGLEEKRGGLGLALPLARRVVERLGGRVWSPAKGGEQAAANCSAIIISLPVAEHTR